MGYTTEPHIIPRLLVAPTGVPGSVALSIHTFDRSFNI